LALRILPRASDLPIQHDGESSSVAIVLHLHT